MNVLPNSANVNLQLLIGGVQKAGTTSLFSYLKTHPDLQAPLEKELHIFDGETGQGLEIDHSRLIGSFSQIDPSKIAFEATPSYLFWPSSLERIKNYNPNMKLIFIFRDPIERAVSNWRMEIARKIEDLPFPIAIREGRWRLRGLDPRHPDRLYFSYVERGFYGLQVTQLLSLFPTDNILFLRSIDLQTNHQSVLTQISNFIGVSAFQELEPIKEHQTPGANFQLPESDFNYLREIYADDIQIFEKLTGLPTHDWLINGQYHSDLSL